MSDGIYLPRPVFHYLVQNFRLFVANLGTLLMGMNLQPALSPAAYSAQAG